MSPPQLSKSIQCIRCVRIPGRSPNNSTWDVSISSGGNITAITPHSDDPHASSSSSPLLLPSLTHPHIHLDKAFIHNSPNYSHLHPKTGTFPEALSQTAQAKASFHLDRADLLRRGEWLLAESLAAGVTSMRAFVEVDSTVGTTCLQVGLDLKRRWAETCNLQIVCFAQDPLFSHAASSLPQYSANGGNENLVLIEQVLSTASLVEGIDVLGTTPYVEDCYDSAKRNVEWAFRTAMEKGLHLDFHLDYNLDPARAAMVWDVLSAMEKAGWKHTTPQEEKKVMLGHCTRLTLFRDREWERLTSTIHRAHLPVSFVGLPTSDIYMASPPSDNNNNDAQPGLKQRGTIHVPDMIRSYDLDSVIGVNNVGNAFTPWGSPDPLLLACLGVGLYQVGSQEGAELLYECVSTRARAAIGMDKSPGYPSSSLALKEGDSANFILVYNVDETGSGLPRSRNSSIAESVWSPPSISSRDVITTGRLVVKPMAAERAEASPETSFVYAK